MDIENKAWQDAIKEITEKLANNTSNLQTIHTPFELVNCMIGKLKENVELKDKTFCVFNLEFVEALIYDYDVARDRIWFVTDCPEKAKIMGHDRYKGVVVARGNFLKTEMIMKFDVVIGNPPYQDSSAKSSKKAWGKFLEKSILICKENGYVAFVTPFSWASPSNEWFNIFKTHEVPMVDLNGKKYFPDLGTTISWYYIQNCNPKTTTKIFSQDEIIEVNMASVDYLPCIMNKKTLRILSAILNGEALGVCFDSFCHTQRTKRVSLIKNEKYCYPVKHTVATIAWSTEKHPNTKIKKVIFPISSAMKAEYDENGEFGCSQHYAWIKVNSKEEAESLICFLNSKIISFVRKATQWTASWSKPILQRISKVPLNQKWTDEELYSFFKITKEEKEYIESIVK